MSITARSTPYRPKLGGDRRQCGCCGIIQRTKMSAPDYYCKDCVTTARALGWIEPAPTYTCTRCNKHVQGQNRDMCGKCKWNTGKGKTR